MKKIVSIPLFILFLISLSCAPESDNKKVSITNSNSKYKRDIQALLDENEMIRKEMAQDNIFQSASANQKNLFRQFVIRSRRFLVLILDDYKNLNALKSLEDEVNKLESLPIATRDQSYIAPYVSKIQGFIEEIKDDLNIDPEPPKIIFNFNERTNSQIIREAQEGAGEFEPNTNSQGSFLSINSFAGKNNGTSSIITPIISLEDKSYNLSFRYLTSFYKPDARKERLIRFYIGENQEDISLIQWQDLNIEVGPDIRGNNIPPLISDKINVSLTDTLIRIKVEYTSDAEKGFFPLLNIFSVIFEENI